MANSLGYEFKKGLWQELPPFRLVLGLCPTLAVTNSAVNGLAMGLATIFVLFGSNILISLVRKTISAQVRIPAYVVIIATLVTVADLFLAAVFPDISKSLGPYIPLIVVNCIILGRAEAFAQKNSILPTAADTLGIGIGFIISLTIMGTIREVRGGPPGARGDRGGPRRRDRGRGALGPGRGRAGALLRDPAGDALRGARAAPLRCGAPQQGRAPGARRGLRLAPLPARRPRRDRPERQDGRDGGVPARRPRAAPRPRVQGLAPRREAPARVPARLLRADRRGGRRLEREPREAGEGRARAPHARDPEEAGPRARSGPDLRGGGLKETRTGDTLSHPDHPMLLDRIASYEPVISQAIETASMRDRDLLLEALARIADEDPSFRFGEDPETGQLLVSGMGELHLEIVAERLRREFGLPVRTGQPQVLMRETLTAEAEGGGQNVNKVTTAVKANTLGHRHNGFLPG